MGTIPVAPRIIFKNVRVLDSDGNFLIKTETKCSHKSMEERMFSITKLLSGRGAVLASLLFTMALGITIGSIVSDGVDGAEKPAGAQELVMQGEGPPVTLKAQLSLQEGFSGIAKAVEPAVVHVYTQSIVKTTSRGGSNEQFRDFFGDDFFERFFGGPQGQTPGPSEQKRAGLGSGVIVDSKGYIITNYHVVAIGNRGGNPSLAEKIEVQTKKGKTYSARVIGVDQETDLAVLKIEADEPLPFLKVGDSTKMNVGDWVLAIGSPFGFDQTLTAGIISATKRVIPTTTFGDYIQTDAAINPGNSGGPLVNMNGEVIGINTFISTTSGSFAGIGFAIPSETFISSYNQLVTEGSIKRGWLGISMNSIDMTPEMAEFFGVSGDDPDGIKDGNGVIVTQLIDETGEAADTGPAAKAGVKEGDVIVKFGRKDITELWDLRTAAANTPPGREVPVVLVRKGEVIETNVTLAERTLEQQTRQDNEGLSFDEKEEESPPKEIGLEFQTLNSRDAKQLGLEGTDGAVVISVTPGSLADDARLAKGMVITQVNGEDVTDAQTFKKFVDKVESGDGIILKLLIGNPTGGATSSVYTSFVKP